MLTSETFLKVFKMIFKFFFESKTYQDFKEFLHLGPSLLLILIKVILYGNLISNCVFFVNFLF